MITDEAAALDEQLRELEGEFDNVELDGSGIQRLDSTGAWLMLRTKRLSAPAYACRVSPIRRSTRRCSTRQRPAPRGAKARRKRPIMDFLEHVGRETHEFFQQAYRLLGFLGRVTVETTEAFLRPDRELSPPSCGRSSRRVRGRPHHRSARLSAWRRPRLSGADQLRRFGAELLTVNLVATAMLREVGCLDHGHRHRGRSGSAFTAQIGTMKLNQEVDAMQTIGLNTVEVLGFPRLLGLMVALPLLTFVANIMGLIGGAMMCYFHLGITVPSFTRQSHSVLTINSWTFWLGSSKRPCSPPSSCLSRL